MVEALTLHVGSPQGKGVSPCLQSMWLEITAFMRSCAGSKNYTVEILVVVQRGGLPQKSRSSPFIQGLHGHVLQDESTGDHEDGGGQADPAGTAQVEAVRLVTPCAALDEVDDDHRGGGIQRAVHGAHCCGQHT